MKGLGYPLWVRAVATPAGMLAAGGARVLFALPDGTLAALFSLLEKGARVPGGGENETSRALSDLALIFGGGGEDAQVMRRVLREARAEELADIVRGAIAGELLG